MDIVSGVLRSESFGIILPSKTVTQLMTTNTTSLFNIYQRLYGIYSSLQLSGLHQYTMVSPKSAGGFWKPYEPCATGKGGKFGLTQQSFTPCPISMELDICVGDAIQTCIEPLLTFTAEDLRSPEFNAVLSEWLKLMTAQSYEELIAILVASSKLNSTAFAANLRDDLDQETKDRLIRAYDALTCRTMLDEIYDKGQRCSVALPNAEACLNGQDAYEAIVSLWEGLRCCNKVTSELSQILNVGIMGAGIKTPIFVMTPDIYSLVARAYNAQLDVENLVNRKMRIEKMMTSIDGLQVTQYMIDGTLIVPDYAYSYWNSVMQTPFSMAYITYTGNQHLGVTAAGAREQPISMNGQVFQPQTFGMTIKQDPYNDEQYFAKMKVLAAAHLHEGKNFVYTLND